MLNKAILITVTYVMGLTICITACANITIVSHTHSNYKIVIPSKPAQSIISAAKELQHDIMQSTGVRLVVVTDTSSISDPFISLGATKQAKAVKISISNIVPGGFRIVSKGDNIYIRGLDTAAKVNLARYKGNYGKMTPQPNISGPQYTKNGGWSNGTANGVYTFLEKRLGVRWLMPGSLGRVVPKHNTFSIPDINRVEQPVFAVRYLGGLEKYIDSIPAVHNWATIQKLGFSFRLNGNHNLWRTVLGTTHVESQPQILKDLYKKHHDWFAMNGQGKRPIPKSHYDKMETTNPGLVQYFANKAVAALKNNPHMNTYSISLSDGRGYSKSPQSKALYDPPPQGSNKPSVTPLVLKWYRDVSKAVAEKDPNAKLAGFLYQQYIYPPQKGLKTLPENFIPFIAPSFDYGYQLYRKDVRKQFEYIMGSWSKISPATWFYFDLPNQIISPMANGLITPPATGILNFIFPRLIKYHIKGAHFYGNTSWSMAAMTNYIDAKLLWNPNLNANDLKRDWLNHAYGKQAGQAMNIFYKHLNGWFSKYWNKHHNARYYATENLFKELYAPHQAELEKLFFNAYTRPMTERQKLRLDLIKDNLIVLQWRLRNAGYLPANFHSALTRTNAQIAKLLFAKMPDGSFDLFPILWYQYEPKRKRIAIAISASPKQPQSSTKKISNKGYILIYSVSKQDIIINPVSVNPLSSFLGYRIYRPRGRNKWYMDQQGLLYSHGIITIHAKANTPYYLSIVPQGIIPQRKEEGAIRYELHILKSTLAKEIYHNDKLYLQPKYDKKSSIYIVAPKPMHLNTRRTPSGDVVLSTQLQADSIRKVFIAKHPYTIVLRRLDHNWNFQPDPKNSGLKQGYNNPNFDDRSWKTISTTDWWQDQGFSNYHGVAWYRKSFTVSKVQKDKRYFLFFGNIDGNANIYVNGRKIGKHNLGSRGKGWDEPFAINITWAIKSGKNNVSICVKKDSHVGGIYRGVSLLVNEGK